MSSPSSSPSPPPPPPPSKNCQKNQFVLATTGEEQNEQGGSPQVLFFTPPINSNEGVQREQMPDLEVLPNDPMDRMNDASDFESSGYYDDMSSDNFSGSEQRDEAPRNKLRVDTESRSKVSITSLNSPVVDGSFVGKNDPSAPFDNELSLVSPSMGKRETPRAMAQDMALRYLNPKSSRQKSSTETRGLLTSSNMTYSSGCDSSSGRSSFVSLTESSMETSETPTHTEAIMPLDQEGLGLGFGLGHGERGLPQQVQGAAHSFDNMKYGLFRRYERHRQERGEKKDDRTTREGDNDNNKEEISADKEDGYKTTRRHHNHHHPKERGSVVVDGKKMKVYRKRYVRGERIGEGSYAKVVEAYDTVSRKVVAVKIFSLEKVKKVHLGESSMNKELRALKELTYNKSVVSLMDFWHDERKGKKLIVMTYMPCGTLRRLLDKAPEHRLPLPQARCLFRCLVNGLAHVHGQGIFHRDIKPDNLLLFDERSLCITDFGTATKEKETKGVGATGFQPPEVAKTGFAPDTAKLDIWAAGLTLYTMVTGQFPFELGSLAKIYEEISRCEIDLHEDTLPADLVTLLKGMLQAEPSSRMSMKEISESPWLRATPDETDGSVKFVAPTRVATTFDEEFVSKLMEAFTVKLPSESQANKNGEQ